MVVPCVLLQKQDHSTYGRSIQLQKHSERQSGWRESGTGAKKKSSNDHGTKPMSVLFMMKQIEYGGGKHKTEKSTYTPKVDVLLLLLLLMIWFCVNVCVFFFPVPVLIQFDLYLFFNFFFCSYYTITLKVNLDIWVWLWCAAILSGFFFLPIKNLAHIS